MTTWLIYSDANFIVVLGLEGPGQRSGKMGASHWEVYCSLGCLWYNLCIESTRRSTKVRKKRKLWDKEIDYICKNTKYGFFFKNICSWWSLTFYIESFVLEFCFYTSNVKQGLINLFEMFYINRRRQDSVL